VDQRDGRGERPARRIDTTVEHPARRYNYWLGGKDHFAVDRASGDAIAAAFPTARAAALANRAFLRRAVTFLTAEAGIRQFLDIGCGIPAPGHTHEVAQAVASQSRVVYVDNDPVVTAHTRALLQGAPSGTTCCIEADLRKYQSILHNNDLTETLDLTQPVALLLVAVLHFVPDADDPYTTVAALLSALAPGSYLVVSHATSDFTTPEYSEKVLALMRPGTMWPRSRVDLARFFAGLELVPPGIAPVADWRPDQPGADPGPRLTPAESPMYCAVGRLPHRPR
jgi:hypothetical protein